MTKEQKELLLTELSARLPYNVKCTDYDLSTLKYEKL